MAVGLETELYSATMLIVRTACKGSENIFN